jgi:hypothetical protein
VPARLLRKGPLCLAGAPSLILVLWLLVSSYAAAQHPAGVEPGESYHRVFVSSNGYGISSSTSFPPPFTAINGLVGADWHVSLAAFSSGLLSEWDGLATTYKAILSTSTVHANTRFSIAGKVFNTFDEKVADDGADFWDGSLDAAIAYDEYGVAIGSSEVWSGSTSLGNYNGATCGDWTDSSSIGDYGDAAAPDAAWLRDGTQNCSNTGRIYGISPAVTLADSADFDLSGVVDGFDFLTLQRGLGTSGAGATHVAGDANGDDFIDADDLVVWEGQYGGAPPLLAIGAVPEPSSFLLVAAAALCLPLSHRR